MFDVVVLCLCPSSVSYDLYLSGDDISYTNEGAPHGALLSLNSRQVTNEAL